MKLRLFVFSFALLFLMSGVTLAQCDTSLSDVDRQLCENEQKLKELKINLADASKPFISDFSQFIPQTKDSWLVSVVYNGGWAGTTRILATIKSDQNYLCREENLRNNHPISDYLFKPYSDLIGKTSFEKLPVYEPKSIVNCNNCSATNLVVYQRKEITVKKEIMLQNISFSFDIDKFTSTDSPVRKLFNKTLEISKCDEIKEYSK